MRDLLLDPDTGDLALVGGGALLTAAGEQDTAQALRITLATQRGTYALDLRAGVPWIGEVLGRPRSAVRIAALLAEVVARAPGVVRIVESTGRIDAAQRAYVGTIIALVRDGAGNVQRATLSVTQPNDDGTLVLLLAPSGGF